MAKSYRLLIAAFVGLVLVAASEPPKLVESPKEKTVDSELAHGLASISSAIAELKQPTEADPPCQPGENNRNSDLCAQWKAADSASDAAQYAYWTMLLSSVGTILLVMTFWETRKTSRAELRAYLSFKDFALHVFESEMQGSWTLRLESKIINSGPTPAYDCVHLGNIVAFSEEDAEAYFAKSNPAPRIGKRITYAVHSGGDVNAAFTSFEDLSQKTVLEIKSGSKQLYAFGTVEYRDTFRRSHYTEFCLVLASPLIPDHRDGSGKTRSDIVWETPPFHNAAT